MDQFIAEQKLPTQLEEKTSDRGFPIELLVLIVSNIQNPPPALLRVSKLFFDLLGPKIYRRLTINGDAHHDPFLDLEKDQQDDQPDKGLTRKERLLQHVKSVVVGQYAPADIGNSLAKLPNIAIIRTTARTRTNPSFNQVNCPTFVWRDQPLFSNWSPLSFAVDNCPINMNKLVIVLTPTRLAGSDKISLDPGIWWLGSGRHRPVKEIVLILESMTPYNRFRLDDLRSEWVFPPFGRYWIRHLLHDIADGYSHCVPRLTLVNFGAVNRKSAGEEVWDERVIQDKMERYLKDKIRNDLVRMDKYAEVQGQLEKIRFLTMGEYADKEDWVGVFDEDELEIWKGGVVGQEDENEDESSDESIASDETSFV